MGGVEDGDGGWGGLLQTERFVSGGVCAGGGANYTFFSLLYGMPAPTAERQHPEAWPASIYGHLRGYPQQNPYLQVLYLQRTPKFAGTVPAFNLFQLIKSNTIMSLYQIT